MADEEVLRCKKRDLPFEEINFISISSQTNVYGLTTFYQKKSGSNVLLLASLKGQIYSISSHTSRPSSLSSSIIPFKNVQGNVDIVSIDAFNYSSDLTIGITFVESSHTNNQKQYFNIYCGQEADIQLTSIAETCQSIELNFVPFHLYHTKLLKDTGVFLLSGSDENIHVFGKDEDNQEFMEFKLENYFPEFLNLPKSVIWLDIHHDFINKRRISACACQNGYLKVVVVGNQNEILNEWTAMHDGPVSSVRIFTLKTKSHEISEELDEILPVTKEINENPANPANQIFHVLVTCVIEPSVIYQDIFKYGLSNLVILPESDKYDCVVCSHITDVDWDGNNEILLGTYGQELLIYKLSVEHNETTESWLQSKLFWQKSFSQPLLVIDYVDLTHDGVRELIIASSKGLYVLQHQFSEISKRFQDEFADEQHAEEENDEKENTEEVL